MGLRYGLLLAAAGSLLADDILHPGTPLLDRPTLMTLGVQLPVTGDDNFNASVTMRYREAGAADWREALPLLRVHAEVVTGWKVDPQFSGSIFDLLPGTTYEIELHAVDPDGVDQIFSLTAVTRAVPGDPASPQVRLAITTEELRAALATAQAGDVIVITEGTYAGPFQVRASGTAENPIVIRGAGDGTVLDAGCTDCNALEIYGAGFVQVERLTISNALGAIRFQTAGAEGNVVRRVHTRNTRLGINSRPDQKDFYICDNVMEGRLRWPLTYQDDGGAHANDDGIRVMGFGHVVCHNRISGFGDAIKTEQDGARAIDFYGNDILYTYDNGMELDGSEGNTRCFRNRFANTFATLSVQPIYGGPAYLFRNVVVNVVNEQMKFHALGTVPPREPTGILAYHNTFVSAGMALSLQTPASSHYFVVANNLFVGSEHPPFNRVVDWTGRIDNGLFDYNGYFPDGVFRFNLPGQGGLRTFPNLAALQEAGIETHGSRIGGDVFASGLIAPAQWSALVEAPDASLGPGSAATDAGLVLPNINDAFTGAAPDLGALETGCPMPIYGPRPEGIDETNEPLDCRRP